MHYIIVDEVTRDLEQLMCKVSRYNVSIKYITEGEALEQISAIGERVESLHNWLENNADSADNETWQQHDKEYTECCRKLDLLRTALVEYDIQEKRAY